MTSLKTVCSWNIRNNSPKLHPTKVRKRGINNSGGQQIETDKPHPLIPTLMAYEWHGHEVMKTLIRSTVHNDGGDGGLTMVIIYRRGDGTGCGGWKI
jgi:hypothetical protein